MYNEFGTWTRASYLHSDTIQRLRRHRIGARCEDDIAKVRKAQRTHPLSFMGDPRSTGRLESLNDLSLVALRHPANRCRSSCDISSIQRGEADMSGAVFIRNFEEITGGCGACYMRWVNSVAFSL